MAVQLPESSLVGVALPAEFDLTDARGAIQRRLPDWMHNYDIVIPGAFLIILAAACFLGPLVLPIPSPVKGNLDAVNAFPLTPGHLFGTDPLGYDIFSRILYGGRVSLKVGLGCVGIGMILGSTLGMIAGLKGGVLDVVIMRILDVFLAYPSLILALAISTYLGPSEIHVIWAISFFSVPAYGRLSRAHTLRVREQVYVVAAKLAGEKDRTILRRHIAPNIWPNLLTFGILGVGIAIVVEAGLSFLGLGVPPPGPSWGNMISTGQPYLESNPYLVLIPSAFLFVTVVCLNMLSDALRVRWATL